MLTEYMQKPLDLVGRQVIQIVFSKSVDIVLECPVWSSVSTILLGYSDYRRNLKPFARRPSKKPSNIRYVFPLADRSQNIDIQ
jgi:hypothetical protein